MSKKGRNGNSVAKCKFRERGAGVEAFFKANGLTPEDAKSIMEGSASIAGHKPNDVRRYRESLKAFDWRP